MKKTYKSLRKEMGMSQREIAKRLKMSAPYYCIIENYKRPLKLKKAIDFASLYFKTTGKEIDFFNDVKHLS